LGDELREAAQSLRRRRAKRVAERDLRKEARDLAAD